MNLARFGVTNPVPVNLMMAALIIAGVACGLNLRREFFPETQPDAARITLPYPGATPQEVEESMARKVEDKLADLDEVDRIITTLAEGGGGIIVEFRDGVDVDRGVDEVQRAIDSLTDLPEEAEEIQVAEFEPKLPVVMVTLYGDADELSQKRAIRRIRDDLKLLPDMGEILISGVREYEIRVDVDSAALLEHSISLPQVAEAFTRWTADVPGGTVRTGVGNISVRTLGVLEESAAIRDIVIKATPDGQSLRLGDIASVREGFVDDQIQRRFATPAGDGPAASLTVFKVGDQDIVQMAEMVKAYVAGRRGEKFPGSMKDQYPNSPLMQAWELGARHPQPLPPGTQLEIHSDLSRFVTGRLDLLSRNAMQGACLVFLTLLLFLNWRAAWWVMMGLFIAICGTAVLMMALDITLNLLTMFGLIVVLGMLVDDAIVVAENIQVRHDRGEPALVAAIEGTREVFWPVVATVTTTIVAFLPLTFIEGRIGDLLGALPAVVACALALSLFESVVMLPSHMGHSLMKRDKHVPGKMVHALRRFEMWRDNVIQNRILPAYARVMEVSLEYRYVSIAIALAVLISAIGLVAGGRVPFTFLTTSDSETLIVDVRMPIGTPIETTAEVAHQIETAARAQPEMKSVSVIIGQRADVDTGLSDAPVAHVAQIFVELVAVEARDRDSQQVIDAIRRRAGVIDGVESIRYSEITGGPGGADITLEVKGEDEAVVLAAVEDIKVALAEYKGVEDISDDDYGRQRELQIALKPGAAALGFTVADVAAQVRGALFGIDAHVFSAQREDIDVRVRIDEVSRRRLDAVENMWLISPAGGRVPIAQVAELRDGEGYATIRRIDRRRTVTVTADTVPATNPEEVMRKMRPRLEAIERAHPGVMIDLGGRQEQMSDAFASLPYGFGAAMIMIYVILAWLFSSYVQPIAVMLAIPFGAIGMILGHLIMGFEMTFLSLIGFVALSGIVVNDSLIYVEFFNDRRREGVPYREALISAGRARLRPIFLTTITTVLGLTPLMLEQSFQARFLIPMAISIAFGLMSATVLILMVLPCILVVVNDLKAATYYLWHGRPRPAPDASAAAPTLEG